MKILVTGASGFLGKKAMKIFKENYEVIGSGFSRVSRNLIKMDVTNPEEMSRVIKQQKPDIIFHAAAMVDVNLCEKNKIGAWKTNVTGPLCLAELCKEQKIKLITISSDYIFSGENSPYNENTPAHPKGFYGFTKLIMEQTVTYINPDSIILRLPILYGYNDPSTKGKLIIPILKSLKEGKEVIIDDYRIKYPVLIDDVIKNSIILIQKGSKGIFNFTADEPLGRFQIANIAAKVFGLDATLIKKGRPKEFPNKPFDVRLVNTRDKSLRFVLFEEGVKIVKQQIESEKKQK